MEPSAAGTGGAVGDAGVVDLDVDVRPSRSVGPAFDLRLERQPRGARGDDGDARLDAVARTNAYAVDVQHLDLPAGTAVGLDHEEVV